jgi:hypothetical protein
MDKMAFAKALAAGVVLFCVLPTIGFALDFHERFESNDCAANTTQTKQYCLPAATPVGSFETKTISANCGSGIVNSKLDGNCLIVTSNLRGCGYDNLIVARNCRGRGWLEYQISLTPKN